MNPAIRSRMAGTMFKLNALLAAALLVALVFWFAVGPIAQDQVYHAFADGRTLFGIPNFWNVVTNLPMMAVALVQLRNLARHKEEPLPRSALFCFFIGVLLAGAGSSYYHLAPDDARLFWDRLPMTVAFMGLFAALLAAFYVRAATGTVLLLLLALGAASAILWRATGDLRLYALVQFFPMVVIGLFLLGGLPVLCSKRGLLLVLTVYGAAKICEFADLRIFEMTGRISGHSLKHILVALAVVLAGKVLAFRRLPPGETRGTSPVSD